MMKYSILLLALIFTACHQDKAPTAKSPFVVRTYNLKLTERIREVLFAQGRYYCLLETGRFICLNRQFQVDSVITEALSTEVFDEGFLWNDELIAAKRIRDNTFEEYGLDQHFQWQKVDALLPAKSTQKEEPFWIHQCCVGEFGGAIFFKDKNTQRIYSCPATCAAALNKIGTHYYLTNFSAHGSQSEILFIEDPRKLYELKPDSVSCNWWTPFVSTKYHSAEIKKFEIGTKKLLDTLGLLTFTSFVRNGVLYHLCSDQTQDLSFVGKLEKDNMQMVDSIFTQNLWSYRPVIGATSNAEVYFVKYSITPGFFAIDRDTISIVTTQSNRQH